MHGASRGQEAWVPSPSALAPAQLDTLTLVGQLLGMALRQKVEPKPNPTPTPKPKPNPKPKPKPNQDTQLSLSLPSMVWKQLVGQI